MLSGVLFTWLLISGLTVGFSTALGWGFWEAAKRDCAERNLRLMMEQKQGPLQNCP